MPARLRVVGGILDGALDASLDQLRVVGSIELRQCVFLGIKAHQVREEEMGRDEGLGFVYLLLLVTLDTRRSHQAHDIAIIIHIKWPIVVAKVVFIVV